MEPAQNALGFADFLAQSDSVGKAALLILLVMSIATWYLIINKTLQLLRDRRSSSAFLREFWNSSTVSVLNSQVLAQAKENPFSRLARQAVVAVRHHERHNGGRAGAGAEASEFLTRSIRQALEEETARVESGLTVLASVGSTAPFVGLFGTVWGIYHALLNIGISGQGTLDKVAGPVGEALIMTAFGLAVAIPAVLAYNAFTRGNRVLVAKLDSFAHDLFSFLTTGAQVNDPARGGEFRQQTLATAGAV
ncbi:MotA/TolQ/ExbB proton channel family protein [Rhodocyclus tenuis]|uniref:Biopolymer transport protein ExbB n=2 Tax=Rhodocyclus TaxID=1064 RepID=A0A6L5JYF9_RHOTE|nr:MotA/TolQ/ExbB proton channel family protein [Rhodocyclus gracilis]MQY52363.1 MotA/TolQ/ExbB proton channel family protein [Rhodocyclus gracilis]NJA90125.1 MotA/TolQ/ExbB proton channel family protein [Rhodocyclus gracilis]